LIEEVVPTDNYDVVIIGGGPGGYAAALYGASAGLDIAMIESNKVGGSCLHVGCIPTKELLETGALYRKIADAADFGISTSTPEIDLAVAQIRKQKVVDQLHAGLSTLLGRRKVTVLDGFGTLHADHVVRVTGGTAGDVELRGEHVILATGSVPRTIPGFDVDGELVVTSDEFLSLQDLPSRAVVVGGGAIGCEFASVLSDLGSTVTVLEALPKILPGCDDDITKLVTRLFKKQGIEIRTGVTVEGHKPDGRGSTAVLMGDGESIDTDLVVIAVGRQPVSEGLGLEGTKVGVSDRGHIEVDELCRTAEPGVYAIGDVIATPALAHVGFAEGILAIKDLLGESPPPVQYDGVPWCIYCHPEVAFAGLSEEAAKAAGYEVVTSKHRYIGNGRALIIGEPDGMLKVIAEKQADGTAGRILGVHMVGPWVTEQLGQAYLSVNWEATVSEVAEFLQPHPTLSELFGESVLALTGRSLHG
jgi:dihydrolipoamide dehydrogenase